MKSFTKQYSINATVEKVWDAMITPKTITAWGAGPDVKMSDEPMSEFSLWGGSIWGKNLEIEEGRYLKQEWYAGDWEEPSIVTFSLVPQGNATAVTLVHENLPDDEAKAVEDGWDTEFMGPLIELVEGVN